MKLKTYISDSLPDKHATFARHSKNLFEHWLGHVQELIKDNYLREVAHNERQTLLLQ